MCTDLHHQIELNHDAILSDFNRHDLIRIHSESLRGGERESDLVKSGEPSALHVVHRVGLRVPREGPQREPGHV